jgi:hypothetical protein
MDNREGREAIFSGMFFSSPWISLLPALNYAHIKQPLFSLRTLRLGAFALK